MFIEKAVLKILKKFLENYLQYSAYSKLITMLSMSSCCCFSRNFPNIFRTSILKEYVPENAPYFVEEHLWMSAFDEATLKFLT